MHSATDGYARRVEVAVIPEGCLGLLELAQQGGDRGGGVAVGRDHAGWQAALGSGLDQSRSSNARARGCLHDRDGVLSQGKQADVKGQLSMEGKSDVHV